MTNSLSSTLRGMSLKSILRGAGFILAGMAVLQIVFFGLLVAGQAVPDQVILTQLTKDIKSGEYGPSGISDKMGGTADTFTECIVAATGLGMEGKNLIERAAFMPRLSNCQLGKQQILDLAAGKTPEPGVVTGYYKYWSGYTVVTRPVIALFGMTGIRIVSGALLLFSAILAVVVLGRRTSMWAAAGLLLPLGLASNIMSTPSTSFSQAISISVIFLGIALTAWGAAKSTKWAIIGVGLSAALFCYVDLLTTPAIPWAFCTVVVAGVTYAKSRALRPTFFAGLTAIASWPIAFGLTWAARWVFAGVFLGVRKTYKLIVQNVENRTTGDYASVRHVLFAPTEVNWVYWTTHISTAIFVLVATGVVIVLALAMTWRRHGARTVAAWPLLAISAVVVIVWFEVLNNHSQIHAFFVYRGYPAMLGVLLFAALMLWGLPKAKASHRALGTSIPEARDGGDTAGAGLPQVEMAATAAND
jgi:hypothetical protein